MAQTTLIYGDSSTFKSSNAGEFADYIYFMTGGITRLVSADSGWGPMKDQIRRNVIQPWNLTSAKYPLACLMKVSRGFWPTVITEDGIANEASLWATPPAQWATLRTPQQDGVFRVGAYIFEGLTMIAELLLSDLTKKQRSTGEPLVGVFEEQGEQFASSSRGSYNFVQKTTRDYIFNLKSLGCWKVLVTGHEGKGEDTARRPTFGPQLAGKAANDKVAAWFENTLHHESYMMTYTRKGKKVLAPGVRAFYEKHQDPEIPSIFWPAKIGAEPRVKAKVIDVYPDGYFPLIMDEKGVYKQGLHTFFRLLDEEETRMEQQSEETQTEAEESQETEVVEGDGGSVDEPQSEEEAAESSVHDVESQQGSGEVAEVANDAEVVEQVLESSEEQQITEEQQNEVAEETTELPTDSTVTVTESTESTATTSTPIKQRNRKGK